MVTLRASPQNCLTSRMSIRMEPKSWQMCNAWKVLLFDLQQQTSHLLLRWLLPMHLKSCWDDFTFCQAQFQSYIVPTWDLLTGLSSLGPSSSMMILASSDSSPATRLIRVEYFLFFLESPLLGEEDLLDGEEVLFFGFDSFLFLGAYGVALRERIFSLFISLFTVSIYV